MPNKYSIVHPWTHTYMRASMSVVPKSNSERGKEFRAKRKRYEEELYHCVDQLREQVEKLQRTRVVDNNHIPYPSYCETGLLIRTIREYFTLFRFGLFDRASVHNSKSMQMAPAVIIDKIERQERFLHVIMDENVYSSGKRGPDACLEQWRLYTLAQDLLRIEVQEIETVHSGEHPIIRVDTHIHFRFCLNTFKIMFPGALQYQDLMNKFLHREVVYTAVFHYQFNEQRRITYEGSEGEFVKGFLDAGCSLTDIAELMQFCVVSPSSSIPSLLPSRYTSHA